MQQHRITRTHDEAANARTSRGHQHMHRGKRVRHGESWRVSVGESDPRLHGARARDTAPTGRDPRVGLGEWVVDWVTGSFNAPPLNCVLTFGPPRRDTCPCRAALREPVLETMADVGLHRSYNIDPTSTNPLMFTCVPSLHVILLDCFVDTCTAPLLWVCVLPQQAVAAANPR